MALDPATTPDPGDPDEEFLPCGAALQQVWEEEAPADGHQACPHCHSSLAALEQLQQTVRTNLAEEEPYPAESFLERVMDVVRTEIRPGRLVPLGEADADDWITETAATRVLRASADHLPGIAVGSCRINADTQGDNAQRPAPAMNRRLPRGPVRVSVEVFADPDRPLPDIAELVRTTLAGACHERLGLDLRRIDITIADLLLAPEPAAQRDNGEH